MIRLKWLSRQAIENMHDAQIAEHGGLSGLRDANALETSLARPLDKVGTWRNRYLRIRRSLSLRHC